MKSNLTTSESNKNLSQNILDVSRRLDLVLDFVIQIYEYTGCPKKGINHSLNYYIADERKERFKAEITALWRKQKMITVDNPDDIRKIHIREKYGSRTKLFRIIFSNIDSEFIGMPFFKHNLAEICSFNINDKKSNERFRNAYYQALHKLNSKI